MGESTNPSSSITNYTNNAASIISLICVIILLVALIYFSAWKLAIYFNTFMYLSKKQNYEKVNYMVNSSFYKYYYSNRLFNGYINIEGVFTIILLLLTFFAFCGFLFANNINLGYLNYYYGDKEEYIFLNTFIIIIIMLAIIYCSVYIYWYTYYKVEDDKLEVKDNALKKFITDNFSYEFLYYYYKESKDDKTQRYTINNFVNNTKNDISTDNTKLFQLCFTSNILNDTERFKYIKNAIINSVKDMNLIDNDEKNIARLGAELKDKLKNTYIIANYNHNNNRALPPLDVMINNLNINITSPPPPDSSGEKIKNKLAEIHTNIMSGDINLADMQVLHNKALIHFIETIKIYKEVYDRNSTYYLVSLLITNFIISYAVLIFIYIFIKIFSNLEIFEKFYNIYKFKTDLLNYGIFILIFYYFVSSPIIIFGFN
jgi:hypothetical protein